jgi:hypothetical protein
MPVNWRHYQKFDGVLNSLKKHIDKLLRFFHKYKGRIKFLLSDKIYVSFGENCLTDNILSRYGLKLLTTPFSHGGSNVEIILNLEKDNYADFMNLNYLKYEDRGGGLGIRPVLKKYNATQNKYHSLLRSGFSFSHHDVIKDEKVRAKMQQRVFYLKKLVGKKRFIILYHHRVNEDTNYELLINHLCELREIYSTEKMKSEIICFTQKIISDTEERSVTYSKEKGIYFFVFNTYKKWEGWDIPELLWARCDDDLIKEMIAFAKKL